MSRSANVMIACAAVLWALPALASADAWAGSGMRDGYNGLKKPTPDFTVSNPVQGVTQLQFSLKQSGAVNLSLYDVAGRLVKKLIDGPMVAGSHTVQWAHGNASVGGVYFARLRTGEKSQTLKVLVLDR